MQLPRHRQMPLKYRSRTDIIANVLETANGKLIIWSNILYSIFLSRRQLKGYVALLIQNDLLKYDPDNKTYKTQQRE
jgi:predicted transcriptional regulator